MYFYIHSTYIYNFRLIFSYKCELFNIITIEEQEAEGGKKKAEPNRHIIFHSGSTIEGFGFN